MRKVKVAGVQMNPKILEKEANLEKCIDRICAARKKGARLVVFPECALTGYCFSNRDEAVSVGETVPGRSSDAIASLCKELDVYVGIGLVEQAHRRLYNAVVLLGADGLIGKYRKTHLPFIGLDRFVQHGDIAPKVYDTPIGKFGINICFEAQFPEVSRLLALQGAEVIILPTSWPIGAEKLPQFVINTRAYENRVYYLAVNRVGTERNFRFIGRSKFSDPTGCSLAEGSRSKEETIYATLDLSLACMKRIVVSPREEEYPLWDERRPELYKAMTRRLIPKASTGTRRF